MSFYNLRSDEACTLCGWQARVDANIRNEQCREQFEPGTFELYVCLNDSTVTQNRTIKGCFDDQQCCDALGEMPGLSCERCVGFAQSHLNNCYSYCDMATEAGTADRQACMVNCNVARESRILNCYELGTCFEQCPPRRGW
jgi:hypothetical protein